MNEIEKLKNEIERLRKYETRYKELVNSKSYKLFRLFESDFLNANWKKKLRFIAKIIYLGIKYLIASPIKNLFHRNIYKTVSEEKTFPNYNLAVILDEFSFFNFESDFNMYYIAPSNWKKIFQKYKIDIFFMESIWTGHKDLWLYFAQDLKNNPNSRFRIIYDILKHCKKNNIPSVFWNKEDPAFFDEFLFIAKEFDYIFTTDIFCVEKYKKAIGHNRVYPLSFGVNIKYFNPIGRYEEKNTKNIFFAGNWYNPSKDERFSERANDYENIIYPSLEYGLEIYSRMKKTDTLRHNIPFPKYLENAIVGTVPYRDMPKVYKKYKMMLNVSTIKNSKTMFPRRVIEAMASGTLVLSGNNEAITNLFESEVLQSSNSEKTKKLIEKYLADDELRYKLSIKAIRKVLSAHTSTHKAMSILRTIYPEINYLSYPLISIFVILKNKNFLNRVLENFKKQKYANLNLIIFTDEEDSVRSYIEKENAPFEKGKVKIIYLDIEKIALKKDIIKDIVLKNTSSEYICRISDVDIYSPEYLVDMYQGFSYTDADIIGKSSYYVYSKKEDKTFLVSKSKNKEYDFVEKESDLGSDCIVYRRNAFEKNSKKQMLKIFSIHRYAYLKCIETKDFLDEEELEVLYSFSGLNLDYFEV